MLNQHEIFETLNMIDEQHLDIRTITMGISLRDCGHPDAKISATKMYDKITKYAENLVKTGEEIEKELGVPIINKRISVTPISIIASASGDPLSLAKALDKIKMIETSIEELKNM